MAGMDRLSAEKPYELLRKIDLVALHPSLFRDAEKKLVATRASISEVLQEFLKGGGFPAEQTEVLDGFLFIFNAPEFTQWHSLNWWEQRQQIQSIKDTPLYSDRAWLLLQQSYLAPYINYADDMVAKSTDRLVKQAWMRKRLVLQECFWNTIDSVSHAAYYKKKYRNMYPALCLLLCNVVGQNSVKKEQFLGIDNGIGYLYKKKSRDSAMFRLIYKTFKLFFRSGVFYIGGLELGLLETDGELSCHGSGAVVLQGW